MKKHNNIKTLKSDKLHCYDSVFEREETVAFLCDYASMYKSDMKEYWDRMKRYYDGEHDIRKHSHDFSAAANLPWVAAQSTDGYIHVETQLQPAIPSFEFSPRDRTDYDKAKQREKIVKFICDNNDMEYKNSRNERSLNIYGSAAYKVCWDSSLRLGCDEGDVSIQTADIRRIITDPTACDVDGCEYIGYVYPMHKNRARRVFANDLLSRNESFASYLDSRDTQGVSAYLFSDTFDTKEDSVTITEWWFRQPSSGSCVITESVDGIKTRRSYSWKAGDIALSVLINGKEIRYIPKYWNNTCFESFPFVIYSKLPRENSIWGKSELEEIIPLIDAKDRELAFAQLNSAYCSNDIIIAEENALCEGETLDNSPGTVWKLRPGMMGKVARLGNGASAQTGLYANSAYWQGLIENTTGNFEVSQGKEPSNVTTATGIALLNERSESRKNLKNADKNAGFKRLFLLCDMTALEHYNDGRIIRMGLDTDEEFVFSYGGFYKGARQKRYIPSIDVTIHLGSSLTNSKAFTVSALTNLMSMKITAENYPIAKAYVQTIGIPESSRICDFLDSCFNGDGADITALSELININNQLEGENE